MRVLVVYESFFGSTRTVAEAVAGGLRDGDPSAHVAVLPAPTAPPDLAEVDLLVVGAPTHLLGLSSPASRWLQAQCWGDPVSRRRVRRPFGRPSADRSLRSWLHRLPAVHALPAAAFDTRMRASAPGHAAPAAARRLRRRGLTVVAPPEGFLVRGVTGPPAPGEQDRAAAWGARLAERARRAP